MTNSEVTVENRKLSYKSEGNVNGGLSGLIILYLVCKSKKKTDTREREFLAIVEGAQLLWTQGKLKQWREAISLKVFNFASHTYGSRSKSFSAKVSFQRL